MVLGLAIAFMILSLVGEVLVRTFGHVLPYEQDDELGWKPRAGLSARYKMRDQSGAEFDVAHSTMRDGFRAFGDLASPRKRVLFVGDSFTGDPNTGNADAYFSVVGKILPVEVFAIGGSGYATLQELLLVRRFAPVIKPDVFVLQYCPNDIPSNSMPMEERTTYTRNQKNLRPYLVDGSIVHRMSAWHPYVLLHNHSRLFRKLDFDVTKLQYRFSGPGGPPVAENAETTAEKAAAIKLTAELMSQFAAALPKGARLFTFSCFTSKPEDLETWKKIAVDARVEAQPSVSAKVEDAEKAGQVVRMADGHHWNKLGNRIAGEELARILATDYLK